MHEQETHAIDADARSASASLRVREFRSTDLSAIVQLFARGWPRDNVTADWLTNHVLLDPRFDPRGLLLAERSGEAVGVVHAVAADEDGQGVSALSGWLPFLVVDPEHRRTGIGSTLLEQAVAYLQHRGMTSVTLAAYPPAYVIPGIDLDVDHDASTLFAAAGFDTIEQPVGMRIELATRTHDTTEATESAIARGYEFRASAAGDIPALMRFAATIGEDWGDVIRMSVLQHSEPQRFQLAFAPDGMIAGFAAFGSYEGVISRFGPFGVDPAHRGASLGRILLDQTLTTMQSRGATEAWFLWTDLYGAAGRLYTRAGFIPFRRFAILRKYLM